MSHPSPSADPNLAPPSEQSVVAVYSSTGAAKRALQQLTEHGFAREHISLVAHGLSDEEELHGFLDFGERTEKDAARGAVLGGILGALAGAAFFWIPGFGPLVILGPLAAAFTGTAVGALVGAMSGWGIPEDEAGQYEEKIKEGELLVIVHADPLTVTRAHHVLEATDPNSLKMHASTSEDAPEIDDRPQAP